MLGSKGQLVVNPPHCGAMNALDAEIRQMEDRLGLSPKARLQLGISYGDAARSLGALNEALDGDEDGAEEPDPRLTEL